MKITLIGAGNVATNLGKALKRSGHTITGVFSRTETSAQELADQLGCTYGTTSAFCSNGSDICIISVKDDVVEEVARQLSPLEPKAIWVHTAGSLPMDILQDKGAHRIGVFYPMQTFSKTKEVDFSRISIFTESITCEKELTELGHTLTDNVYHLDSIGRKHLHLAAVFACNFVNHCYALSEEVLSGIGIPFSVMMPLIEETAQKVHTLSPKDAQTGPASRGDKQIVHTQSQLLSNNRGLQEVYDLLSRSIMDSRTE